MKRPSHKELSGKIRAAKEAVAEGNISLINHAPIIADALELGYSIKNDLQDILLELLEDTKPEDYAGNKPPHKSYEKEIKGLELFAFKKECSYFSDDIYYKFTLYEDELFLVSLHKNRN